MREESHLDDMRSAIRGDFERLAERRGGQELMREPEPEPDIEPESDVPEPELIHEAEPDPVPVVEPPRGAETGTTPEQELETELISDEGSPEESALRRSFLDRLLGR